MKRTAAKGPNRVSTGEPGSSVSALRFVNRQRTKPLNLPLLRRVTEAALAQLPAVSSWDLTFYFVGAKTMAELNASHLKHEGPTDVITFDYTDQEIRPVPGALANLETEQRNAAPMSLHGEVFVCVDVAIIQAREFRVTWQSEVVRYLVHGLLHLCGYDDLTAGPRRRMKRVENRLVRRLEDCFNVRQLGRS